MGLTPVSQSPFLVLASAGCEPAARRTAARCEQAGAFLTQALGPSPSVIVWVLGEADWAWWSPGQVYGMPHYERGNLYLAGGKGEFWRSLVDVIEANAAPDLVARVSATYPGPDGCPDLTPFFDLLAVHELAHSYQDTTAGSFPRRWLEELFANLCLHAYVAGREPGQLPALETFPEVFATLDGFRYRSLEDFEAVYSAMDPPNYAWYQSRFHQAARRIYDTGGIEALRRLWGLCSGAEEALAWLLEEKVDREVAGVLTAWPR